MKEIALYIRTSRDRQALGLIAQEKSLRDYIKRHRSRFLVNGKMPRIRAYIDENKSGKLQSRPAFDKLLTEAREGRVSHLLTYSYSRLARSLRHLLAIEAELRALQLPLISITDSVDTSTPTGRLVFQLIASVSEFESSIASERTKNALAASNKQLGRPKININKNELYSLHQSGESYRSIAKKLKVSPATVFKYIKEREKCA